MCHFEQPHLTDCVTSFLPVFDAAKASAGAAAHAGARNGGGGKRKAAGAAAEQPAPLPGPDLVAALDSAADARELVLALTDSQPGPGRAALVVALDAAQAHSQEVCLLAANLVTSGMFVAAGNVANAALMSGTESGWAVAPQPGVQR